MATMLRLEHVSRKEEKKEHWKESVIVCCVHSHSQFVVYSTFALLPDQLTNIIKRYIGSFYLAKIRKLRMKCE